MNANNHLARYQAVQIRTSTPGEVLIALYDGLFRFLHLAKHSIQNNKRGPASEALSKAYKIISEFYVSLDHPKYPELCQNLEAVYDFCMQRVTYANRHMHLKSVDDVIRTLTPIRDAFTTVVRSLAANQAQAEATAQSTPPTER